MKTLKLLSIYLAISIIMVCAGCESKPEGRNSLPPDTPSVTVCDASECDDAAEPQFNLLNGILSANMSARIGNVAYAAISNAVSKQQGKPLKYVVIHCTATPAGREVSAANIRQWHLIGRGWSQVGYSDFIHLDGTIENLVPYNADSLVEPNEITNGVKGMNSQCRSIAYVGGVDLKNKPADTRTTEQKLALKTYIRMLLEMNPSVKVALHNDFTNKACPSFTHQWLIDIGVPKSRIYNVS